VAVRGRSLLSWPTLLGTLFSHARLAIRLIRDPSVSWFSKALPVLATLYVVSPFDLVPDVIPVLGQLDDLAILVGALEVFLRVCPPAAVAFHRAAITERRPYSQMPPTDNFIDAEFKRE